MRTTLNLDDAVIKAAKQRALLEGTTLTKVVEAALREHLLPRSEPAEPYRLEIRAWTSGALPGVDLADRDALYEVMEGRR